MSTDPGAAPGPEAAGRGRRPGGLARRLFVGAALLGVWLLLPSLRRVDLEIRIEGLPSACIDEVDLRLAKEGELHHRLRLAGAGPRLPPWEVWVRPGTYRLEGAVVCSIGATVPRVPIRSRTLSIDERLVLSVPVAGTCSCPELGRSPRRSSPRPTVVTGLE